MQATKQEYTLVSEQRIAQINEILRLVESRHNRVTRKFLDRARDTSRSPIKWKSTTYRYLLFE